MSSKLAEQRRRQEEEEQEVDDILEGVRGSIANLLATTHEADEAYVKSLNLQDAEAKTVSHGAQEEMAQRLAMEEKAFQQAREANKAEEEGIRKKRNITEIGLKSRITEYDKEMGEIQGEYDKLEADLRVFGELVEKYDEYYTKVRACVLAGAKRSLTLCTNRSMPRLSALRKRMKHSCVQHGCCENKLSM